MADITGNNQDNYLYGTDDADTIKGLAGNDYLAGYGGDDKLYGGVGNDTFEIWGGNDAAFGQDGDDTFYAYNYGTDRARILGGDGRDYLYAYGDGRIVADMGSANDLVVLYQISPRGVQLTLGEGRDVVQFSNYPSDDTGVVTITDFATGDSGDVILSDTLQYTLFNYDGYGNPFGSGHLRLVQDGADTLLQIDLDGLGGNYDFVTLAVMENTEASAFTASNFGYFDPDGSPIPGNDILGTTGDDYLDGTFFSDTIDGLAGNDYIYAYAGDDVVTGGLGNDTIDVGFGNDFAAGGAGDDNLYSYEGGNDELYGNAGNDYFYVYRGNFVSETILVNGGAGDDYLYATTYSDAALTAIMGDGQDTVDLYALSGSADIRLGEGKDMLILPAFATAGSMITVRDFQTGNFGDKVDLRSFYVMETWNGDNPFGSGYLRLVQDGTSTVLEIDADGGGDDYMPWVVFENTTVADFTATNFNGFPPDGSPKFGMTYTGTEGDDSLYGDDGANVMEGLGGNDYISGGEGQDRIYGGSGDDTLIDGRGSDLVYGQGGNDFFYSYEAGNDVLNGQAGNDDFYVARYNHPGDVVTVNGGAGNDTLDYFGYDGGRLVVRMGGGDDVVNFYDMPTQGAKISLGSGMDALRLPDYISGEGSITVTDFETGDTGDQLDFSNFLYGLIDWNGTDNVFGAGYLALVQDGSDVILQLDRDGSGDNFVDLVTLQNTEVSAFTAYNLSGIVYDPTPIEGQTIVGTDYSETLEGGGGDDTIIGLGGNDYLRGGAGDDLLNGGTGYNTFDGGSGEDTVSYRWADGSVVGYLGSNYVSHGTGYDYLYDIENILGSDYADYFQGNYADNVLSGFGGNDYLYGFEGDDTLVGGDGNDYLVGGLGNDILDGGEGIDTIGLGDFDSTSGIRVDLRSNTVADDGFGGSDTLSSIENVYSATQFADEVYGNVKDNVLYAGSGDTAYGLGGDDTIYVGGAPALVNGGAGVDTFDTLTWDMVANEYYPEYASYAGRVGGIDIDLSSGLLISDGFGGGNGTILNVENVNGTSFNDTIRGDENDNMFRGREGDDYLQGRNGNDIMYGDDGNDTLLGGKGDDQLWGGNGSDTASYRFALDAVNVSLAMQGVAQDTGEGMDILVSIENLTGSKFGDVLTGDGGANLLQGLNGDDTLNGGAGDDTLVGGRGNDTLSGGFGTDTVSYFGATGGVTVSLASQNVFQDTGSQGMDRLYSIENLTGTQYNDTFNGDDGDNWLIGLGGDDRLNGRGGDDQLNGGNGNDVLFGGGGNDTLTGGSGMDYFNFANGHLGTAPGSTDTILDFSQADGDMIRLTGIDADTSTAGDQDFTFIGEAAFSGTAGEMRYFQNNGHTYLEMDTNGDGMADMYLDLKGNVELTNDDFFL